MSALTVEVIIPFRRWDAWVAECVRSVLALQPPCQWVTLVPDRDLVPECWAAIQNMPGFCNQVCELPSGPVNPGQKRNLAMARSQADIFGFIDADARAFSDWLARVQAAFTDARVAILGGPNLTPPEDHPLQKACGDVMASPIGMGAAYIRHVPVRAREVTELPTCNMLSRNIKWLRFDPRLDTSEDMVYCGQALARGYKLIYDPEVRVHHHRRRLGLLFIRQFYDYGLNQGRRAEWKWIWRAAPLGFVFYVASLLVIAAFFPSELSPWLAPLSRYFLIVGIECIRLARWRLHFFLTLLAFPAAHVSYGCGYLQGWMKIHLRSGRLPKSCWGGGADDNK